MRARGLRYLLPAGFFTLRWWEWGPPAGPAVVCVHGLTRTGRDFDALAVRLAAAGRLVLCPDLPGRGGSEWLPDAALYEPGSYLAALAALLARVDGPVDWVGTSLGGILGMLVAGQRGTPLRRLVLNDIGTQVSAAAIGRLRAYVDHPEPFADAAALEAYLRVVHAGFGPMTAADWRHLAATSGRRDAAGALRLHYDPAIGTALHRAGPGPLDLTALWDRVTQPVLVLHGAVSDVLPQATAHAMAARPGTSRHEVPGVGHAPALADAAQAAVIEAFLAR